MENFAILVWLLPNVFMIHDFEEIILFKSWIKSNAKEELAEKLPKISNRLPNLNNISTSALSLAVAEEFILLSLITAGSVIFDNYILWLAAFMGFFIHLLIHLGQGIILKRYVFGFYTSIPALIYCVYTLNEIITKNIFLISEILLWTIIGIVLLIVNMIFALKLAEIFNKSQKHES